MALAPMPDEGPFAGLAIPDDVRVNAQILAEPEIDLNRKTWARLADGTPLVTGAAAGHGWIVLLHTTAWPEWSNLGLSGLFPEMLRRLLELSRGVTGAAADRPLPPLEVLDGYGHAGAPAGIVEALPPRTGTGVVAIGPRHPPGLYGDDSGRVAVNLGPTVRSLAPMEVPPGARRLPLDDKPAERDLQPLLLLAAAALLLLDALAVAVLGGLIGRRGLAAVIVVGLLLFSGNARADDSMVEKAALQTRLAYVITGDARADDTSRMGLNGLTLELAQRTTANLGEPMGVDPATDPLMAFPLLYWPVTDAQGSLSPAARAAVNDYLHKGGMIMFDTRDGGDGSPERLRNLTEGIDIPPLTEVTSDHVLTRTFYLLREMPGRVTGAPVFVQQGGDPANDGVSPIVIGGNDYAAAWAVDRAVHLALRGGAGRRGTARTRLPLRHQPGHVRAHRQLQIRPSPSADHPRTAQAMMLPRLLFAPWIPLWALAALALAGLALTVLAARGRGWAAWWRLLPLAVVLLALANPRLTQAQATDLDDVALVLVDESASMNVSGRHEQAEAALAGVVDQLKRLAGLEVRVERYRPAPGRDEGTQLFHALDRALADVPRSRLAGTIMITDGEVHDVPAKLDASAPLHALIVGHKNERDRRLVIDQAPAFGIVGNTAALSFHVEDPGFDGAATVTIRRDAGTPSTFPVQLNQPSTIDIPLDHAGANVVELSVEAAPNELTLANNRAAVVVSGVRDRLRVLLISGEPHAGERVWRNLLKADPSVDLVHFTILRPPEKDDATPLRDLALIAFPVRELFEEKLKDFDLIILDRLPPPRGAAAQLLQQHRQLCAQRRRAAGGRRAGIRWDRIRPSRRRSTRFCRPRQRVRISSIRSYRS